MQKEDPTKKDEPETMGSTRSRGERATEIALCLRDWLARNPGIGTLRKLSISSGVPYSTLKKVAAAQHPPSRETLRRLVEGAGVESLRQWLDEDGKARKGATSGVTRAGVTESESCEKSVSSDSQRGQHASDIEQKVRRIVGTFYSLKDQLDFLKGENEEGRQLFRQAMSKRDAAYVLALLQALFSEDEFQKWIFFSEYRAGEKKP